MSLAGTGVIAIWQDLLPEAKQDFQEWHNRQHVPERLGIRGFRRARRFIAVEGSPEFFTLYEADSPEVVTGKDYLDRLNSPTEWTRRIMPAFRNMARSVCRVAYTAGAGEGGYMLTRRFDIPEGRSARSIEDYLSNLLPPLSQLNGIVGVHLCLGDPAASNQQTFEKTFRAEPDIVPACLIMIEGTAPRYVRDAGDLLTDRLASLLGGNADTAIYQLEHASVNTPATRSANVPKENVSPPSST